MKNWIAIADICSVYKIETHFIHALAAHELITITFRQDLPCIEESSLGKLERILRLSEELEVNIEGIDVILNLIKKIEDLQEELLVVKSRLGLYE